MIAVASVILFLEKGSTKSKNHGKFDNLRKMGDDKYNKKYVTDLIVVQKTYGNKKAEYVTCRICKGMYTAANYKKHVSMYTKDKRKRKTKI